MTRDSRWLLAGFVIGAALGIISAIVGGVVMSLVHHPIEVIEPQLAASALASSPASEQSLFVTKLLKDKQSFDRGVLAYSPIGSLDTATSIKFSVTVTDVGRGSQQLQVTEFEGMSVYQQDVPTGGIVGVQIVGCENLTCDSLSSLQQPVLQKGQYATWSWWITPGKPGPAKVTLRVDTYDQGSGVSLSEEIVQVTAKVVPTAAYVQQQSQQKITGTTKSVLGYISSIVRVAVAVGGILGGIAGWLVRKWRKPDQKQPNTAAK